VLALATGSVTWFLSNYEPLRFDGGGFGIRPYEAVVHESQAPSPPGPVGTFTRYRVAVGPGERVGYAVSIHNPAPFPVEIVSVEPIDARVLPVVGVRILPGQGLEPATETLPFTIAPHEWAAVHVEFAAPCLDEATLYPVRTMPVTFRMLGVTRHADIALPMTIRFTGSPGSRCS
jgi:hypothetical protein